jgi:ABC-type polysaccharide transport system permease subunit
MRWGFMMPGLDVLPSSVKNKKNKPGAMIRRLQREREVWLLCVPIVVWIIIFSYVPLYGLIIAFVDYAPGYRY